MDEDFNFYVLTRSNPRLFKFNYGGGSPSKAWEVDIGNEFAWSGLAYVATTAEIWLADSSAENFKVYDKTGSFVKTVNTGVVIDSAATLL